MSRTRPLVALAALLAIVWFGASALPTSAYFPADKEATKVLKHLVMYKFKDTTTPEQVAEVVAAFSKLPKQIDGIVGFEHGVNSSEEGKSEGLTHIFVVSFKDKEALAAYIKHPAHDAYVQVVKDKREKVVVFDYTTTVK